MYGIVCCVVLCCGESCGGTCLVAMYVCAWVCRVRAWRADTHTRRQGHNITPHRLHTYCRSNQPSNAHGCDSRRRTNDSHDIRTSRSPPRCLVLAWLFCLLVARCLVHEWKWGDDARVSVRCQLSVRLSCGIVLLEWHCCAVASTLIPSVPCD